MATEAEQAAAARALEKSLSGMLAEAGVEAPEEGKSEEDKAREKHEAMVEFNKGLAELSPGGPKTLLGKGLEEAPSSTESAAQEDEHEAEVVEDEPKFELPNLDPKLPEDLAEELAMDWEDEDDEPVAVVSEDDEEEEYEDDDPRVEQLRAELRKAQKRAEWADKQRLESKRERWAEEAKKYFPLSEAALPNIQATSHRGYLREAKAAHDSLKPFVSDLMARYQASIDGARSEAMKEAEEEAKRAWGKSTVQPLAQEMTTEGARRERLSEAKTLEQRIKARIYGG